MEQWVIYDHPADYPNAWVILVWQVGPGWAAATGEVWLRPSLDQAREVVLANYPGGYRLDRSPGDDPAITEVWI